MKKLISLLLLLSFTIKAQDVTIGTQTWAAKNLDVSTYRNGDKIPQVQDKKAWTNLKTGAWCYYENNTANGTKYGKLYNWYAVNDPRGLAPNGYYIPSHPDWEILKDYLGGELNAGTKLKESGTTFWKSPTCGRRRARSSAGWPRSGAWGSSSPKTRFCRSGISAGMPSMPWLRASTCGL